MQNKFICPHCGKRQPINRLFSLKKQSVWVCNGCNRSIKPKNINTIFDYVALLLVIMVAIYSVLILKSNFTTALLLIIVSGITLYLIKIIYYYIHAELKTVN